jgi:hypothetical protein
MKKEIKSLEEFIFQIKEKRYSNVTIIPFGNIVDALDYDIAATFLENQFIIRFVAKKWFSKIIYDEYLYSFFEEDFTKREGEIKLVHSMKMILIAEQRLTTLQKAFPKLSIPIIRIDNKKPVDIDCVHKYTEEHNITIDTDLKSIK